MKKTYCDKCEVEFTMEDHQPLFLVDKKKKTVIALEVWHENGYKGGDLCNICAIDTINNGDIMCEEAMDKLRYKWRK